MTAMQLMLDHLTATIALDSGATGIQPAIPQRTGIQTALQAYGDNQYAETAGQHTKTAMEMMRASRRLLQCAKLAQTTIMHLDAFAHAMQVHRHAMEQ